jgi:hypothetical protein
MPIKPAGALSAAHRLAADRYGQLKDRANENLQTIKDCTGIEVIYIHAIVMRQSGGRRSRQLCRAPTHARKRHPARAVRTLHCNNSSQNSQSSEASFFTNTSLVYARTTRNVVAITIPTIPTQVMMASPRRWGFSKSTTYPYGAGTMGLLRSIVA